MTALQNSIFWNLTWRLELFMLAVPVPVAIYFSVFTGVYNHSQNKLTLIILAGILSIAYALASLLVRHRDLNSIFKDIQTLDQENLEETDKIALVRKLHTHPLREAVLAALRWVSGVGLMHLIFSTMEESPSLSLISIPILIVLVVPTSVIIFYLTTESVFERIHLLPEVRAISIQPGDLPQLGLYSRILITYSSLVLVPITYAAYSIYAIQTGLVSGDSSLLHFSIMGALFLIPVLLVSHRIAIAVKRSITNVNAVLTQVGKGNFEVFAAMTSSDEFSEQAFHTNKIIQQLQNYFREKQILDSKVESSDRKYRHLVEDSSDVIFTLDGDLNITSINKTLKKHLGFRREDVMGGPFLNLVDFGDDRNNLERDLLADLMQGLKGKDKGSSFTVFMRGKYSAEPREMQINLDYLQTEAGGEFMGKASLASEDVYMMYLQTESHSYHIENYLRNADIISQRLSHNLHKYLDAGVVNALRICLREMLINAIEHGNLEITFEDKTRLMEEGNYLDFVYERQRQDPYRSRRVSIDYSFNLSQAVYRITDNGPGFDHAKMRKNALEMATENMITHGRGIAMSEMEFDQVEYNLKGNQVVLVKKFEFHKHD